MQHAFYVFFLYIYFHSVLLCILDFIYTFLKNCKTITMKVISERTNEAHIFTFYAI